MKNPLYRLRTPEGEEFTYSQFVWHFSFFIIWFFGLVSGILLTILFYL